jgi:hypothetical protein
MHAGRSTYAQHMLQCEQGCVHASMLLHAMQIYGQVVSMYPSVAIIPVIVFLLVASLGLFGVLMAARDAEDQIRVGACSPPRSNTHAPEVSVPRGCLGGNQAVLPTRPCKELRACTSSTPAAHPDAACCMLPDACSTD